MNDWALFFGFFMLGVMLSLMTLGLGAAIAMPAFDRWRKCFFIVLFSILAAATVAGLVDTILYGNPRAVLAEKALWYIETLFVMVALPMFTLLLLHCSGESIKESPMFRAVAVAWFLFFILLQFSSFTNWFYYLSADYEFQSGDWFLFLCLPLLFIMFLNLEGTIRRRNKLSRKQFIAFLIHLLPLTFASLVHAIFFNLWVFETGLIISILPMFAILLLDQTEEYLRQQRELSRQQARIMVLQMRPHFIYNTMMSIDYLCVQDPAKAQAVTLDFTTYLRKNFTAIASEDTIPFTEELEHTRAYLAVEKAQFENSLFIEYDTPHTWFRLPPLTLQPIVENAVKHGMDPESGPLRIRIQTRETDSGSEIIVEDNGSGFEAAPNDDPHIALSNIQQRLAMLCDGEMTITPRDGGGTVVKVTVR